MSLPIALAAGMPILRFKESFMNSLLSVTSVFTCYPLTAKIKPSTFLNGCFVPLLQIVAGKFNHHQIFQHWILSDATSSREHTQIQPGRT